MSDSNNDPWSIIDCYDDPAGVATVTERISVPGGWIYRTIVGIPRAISTSMVFVPFARFTGDEMSGLVAASAKPAPDPTGSKIPDFSAPAPRRGEDWGRVG